MSEEEQEYDLTYLYFIFIPSVISLFISVLLLFNFFFVSKHLKSFIYHKLAAALAVFDFIQQAGTLLGAPFLFSADEDVCPYREYMFLFGSFCKTLTVLYISGLIAYVIHFSKVPNEKLLRRCFLGFVVGTICLFIAMIALNTSAALCFDPTAGNFDMNHVEKRSAAGFMFLYLAPIAFGFIATVSLIIHTFVRLKTMFNSAMLKMLMRLIPGPIIFCLALVPSVAFEVIEMFTDQESGVAKKCALLGINFSGALFALIYFYSCLVDNSLYAQSSPSTRNAGHKRNVESLSWETASSIQVGTLRTGTEVTNALHSGKSRRGMNSSASLSSVRTPSQGSMLSDRAASRWNAPMDGTIDEMYIDEDENASASKSPPAYGHNSML